MKRTVVHTDKVPPARVPLSQAIAIGDWIFVSGQLGMDPKTGRLVEGGITAETRPARTTFQAAGLVAGARVEIEAIAIAWAGED